MEGTASAGQVVVSPATAAALPRRRSSASRTGPGFRLRRVAAPRSPRTRPDRPADVRDVDLAPLRPDRDPRAPARPAASDPEHRQVTVAFLHFDGTDELLARRGPGRRRRRARRARHRRAARGRRARRHVPRHRRRPRRRQDHPRRRACPRRRATTTTACSPRCADIVDRQPPAPAAHRRAPRPGLRRRGRPALPAHVHRHGRHREPRRPPHGRGRAGQILATPRGPRPVAAPSFDTDALEPFMVKGKRQPVEAFALGAAQRRGRGPRRRDLPLVGRDDEIAVVHRGARRAARPATGRVDRARRDPRHRQVPAHRGAAAPAPGTCPTFVDRVRPVRGHDAVRAVLVAAPRPARRCPRPPRPSRSPRSLDATRRASSAPSSSRGSRCSATPLDLDLPDTAETAALAPEFRRERVARGDGALPRPRAADGGARRRSRTSHWMDDASSGGPRRSSSTTSRRAPRSICATRRERRDRLHRARRSPTSARCGPRRSPRSRPPPRSSPRPRTRRCARTRSRCSPSARPATRCSSPSCSQAAAATGDVDVAPRLHRRRDHRADRPAADRATAAAALRVGARPQLPGRRARRSSRRRARRRPTRRPGAASTASSTFIGTDVAARSVTRCSATPRTRSSRSAAAASCTRAPATRSPRASATTPRARPSSSRCTSSTRSASPTRGGSRASRASARATSTRTSKPRSSSSARSPRRGASPDARRRRARRGLGGARRRARARRRLRPRARGVPQRARRLHAGDPVGEAGAAPEGGRGSPRRDRPLLATRCAIVRRGLPAARARRRRTRSQARGRA